MFIDLAMHDIVFFSNITQFSPEFDRSTDSKQAQNLYETQAPQQFPEMNKPSDPSLFQSFSSWMR